MFSIIRMYNLITIHFLLMLMYTVKMHNRIFVHVINWRVKRYCDVTRSEVLLDPACSYPSTEVWRRSLTLFQITTIGLVLESETINQWRCHKIAASLLFNPSARFVNFLNTLSLFWSPFVKIADRTNLSVNQWRHSDTDLDAWIQTMVWGHVIQDGRQNVNKAQAAAIDVGPLFRNGRVVFEIGQK